MAYQIALAWSDECEKELRENGFTRRVVYLKTAPGGTTEQSETLGDREFFSMKSPPFQFVTTSYWGAGND